MSTTPNYPPDFEMPGNQQNPNAGSAFSNGDGHNFPENNPYVQLPYGQSDPQNMQQNVQPSPQQRDQYSMNQHGIQESGIQGHSVQQNAQPSSGQFPWRDGHQPYPYGQWQYFADGIPKYQASEQLPFYDEDAAEGRKSSPVAVIGCICAGISLFAVPNIFISGLLLLVAIVLCVIGLFRKPRGCAIAGLIISGLMIALWIFIVYEAIFT